MKTVFLTLIAALTLNLVGAQAADRIPADGVESFDTGYTITKVRTASGKEGDYILASSYEGTLLGVSFDGHILWSNPLSGYMNHDLWAGDIDSDGIDEIFAANADGHVYALDGNGDLLWSFKRNDAPMNAVTTVKKGLISYVVCGGYDRNIYYLDVSGNLVKTIPSDSYSKASVPKRKEKKLPPKAHHSINFLRPLRQTDGSELLVVNATNNSMQTPGFTYLFEPLATEPISATKGDHRKAVGDLRMADLDGDGNEELILGNSTATKDASFIVFDPFDSTQNIFRFKSIQTKLDGLGYRVIQTETVPDGDGFKFLSLVGSRIVIVSPDLDADTIEVLEGRYSYYDMWKHPESSKIILASAQSGGSAIHILDTQIQGWEKVYEKLSPVGKINEILVNTASTRAQLAVFESPKWERTPLPVYFLSEHQKNPFVKNKVAQLKKDYPASPVFLVAWGSSKVENWDRSSLGDEVYQAKRDQRKKYVLTQKQILKSVAPLFQGDSPGAAFWGGHGNDPYMYSLETDKKFFDLANGKKTVLIYPELNGSDKHFAFVMNDLVYPLAEHAKKSNGFINIRVKHTFWQAYVHLPLWSRLVSGEFADVFIPSMEETTDKSMELSIAGRVGIWAAGSVNQWGARSARDNPSFDRTRQFSHQMLPNHFLRQMVYSISSGATEINNFAVDQEYMSLLWDLIAKGALYVPKRNELLHLSPVHLSIVNPDARYLDDGHNVKWTSFYEEQQETENPMVFSRLNGSWPGAVTTEWDFSRYAAGVKERRHNFLPPYKNGLVMITPSQSGAECQPRGLLKNNLHPLYGNILTEYITDGRNYYSPDLEVVYKADSYYKKISKDIEEKAKLLPLTVSGDVAWTVAQTSPTHLRVTLIDSGYLNPKRRIAKINFQAVVPVKMVDVLDGEQFDITSSSEVAVDVPLGLFRFLDIELSEAL